jgi:hypothetical protein
MTLRDATVAQGSETVALAVAASARATPTETRGDATWARCSSLYSLYSL